MNCIVLTAEMRAKFEGIAEKREIRDEGGSLIGYFQPTPQATPAAPKYEAWGPFTAEEVERASRQTGPGRTLDEIIAEAGLS